MGKGFNYDKIFIDECDFVPGHYDLNIDIKNSEPACMICLPPSSLKDHKSLNGTLIHSRIDCPPDVVYMINEDMMFPNNFKNKKAKRPPTK